jgi:exosortase E/protease (VPEID-CTERM system)
MAGFVQSRERDAWRLRQRVLLLAAVLGLEALLASIYLDGETLRGKHGILTDLIRDFGAWSFRGAIGFAALFATFAWLKHKSTLTALSDRGAQAPFSRAFLAAHLIAAPIFAALSVLLYGQGPTALPIDVIAVPWMLAGIAVVVSAGLAFVPLELWAELRRVTGNLWLYAFWASTAACVLGAYSRALWPPTTRLTFHLVKLLLQPVFHHLVIQPGVMRIGTDRFRAIITPECSGLEGVSLMLIFGVLWLILFRAESRFPQSLLLLPAAVVALFLLNAVRIATLILIGHAGARDVATRGFHSQAGWISFNLVALGFSLAARRLSWFSKIRPEPALQNSYNPAAAFLLPFLTILAARMISRASSGNFEWTYPLAFAAAATVLWLLRDQYSNLFHKVGWMGPAYGALVFILWVALDGLTRVPASPMPQALAAAPSSLRDFWIVLRVLSAVVTVPVAEELAFRGFLLRRLIAHDFERLSFHRWTWFSLLASSLAFGAMHGDRWLAGTAAGLIYATAAIRSGRLSEAIVAHAITNALLAAYVLLLQNWQYW